MNRYHLQLRGNHWLLEKEGTVPPIKSFWTKREGVMYSLDYIEHYGGSLTIHRLDGTLQEERSYPGGLEPVAAAA